MSEKKERILVCGGCGKKVKVSKYKCDGEYRCALCR